MSKSAVRTVILLTFLIAACNFERRTNVDGVEGENPPTFVLSGSGNLAEVIFYQPGEKLMDESSKIWEIQAENTPGDFVEEIHTITYGITPAGYKQLIPKNEQPPRALLEASNYGFWFYTLNAPTAFGHFEMHNNKAVILDVRH